MRKKTESFIRLIALTKLNPALAFASVVGGTALIFALDYLTPNELAFSFFYLIPIAIGMLFIGRAFGYSNAVFSALISMAVRFVEGPKYSQLFFFVWALLLRIGTDLLFAFLLDLLRQIIDDLGELSLRDPLTGAANRRYLEEFLDRAKARALREKRPLSIAVMDIDDFKSLNDRFGHARGDEALVTLARSIQSRIRPDDMLARIGGDEFVIVLDAMDHAQSEDVIGRLMEDGRRDLAAHGIEASLSLGVVTYASLTDSPGAMLARADSLMYEVKRSGKNGMRHVDEVGLPS